MSAPLAATETLLTGAPRTLIGAGLSRAVAEEIEGAAAGDRRRAPRVFLVTGAGFSGRPWSGPLLEALRPFRPRVGVQAGMPTPASVAELARALREHRAEVVVAAGGGSVMDAAKAAAALAPGPEVTPALVTQACESGPRGTGLPVVALPSTPGTGAESTPFATVWDVDRGRKLSLRGESLLPAVAILDPDLLLGLPSRQLTSNMLDTLAQGVEAAWSTRSDARAERLGAAAWGRLADLLDQPPHPPSAAERHALLLAGHLSGRAIAIAGTTVCHALSYPLTLRHGLSHGHACGVTLAGAVRFNAAVQAHDCADSRGPGRVREAIAAVAAAAGAGDAEALAGRVEAFLARSGLPGVPDLGPDAPRIARQALGYDRAGNNPRHLDVPALARLLTS
ncbi:iron-containing alcohol dehydrogenase [Nonomuraea candida]|uniref:iron-containing alcohol dehydrogenase n=1 Tax=Nonomuraea candida TaxID=359159 RepID=UPI0006935390|nr:iron-containing alcohol dehydrogenase [Nonomuraea candida]